MGDTHFQHRCTNGAWLSDLAIQHASGGPGENAILVSAILRLETLKTGLKWEDNAENWNSGEIPK